MADDQIEENPVQYEEVIISNAAPPLYANTVGVRTGPKMEGSIVTFSFRMRAEGQSTESAQKNMTIETIEVARIYLPNEVISQLSQVLQTLVQSEAFKNDES